MPLSKLLSFRRPKRPTLEEYFTKLKEKGLHQDGTPVLDPTPMAPPVGYVKAPSMIEMVRDMVRGEQLAAAARAAGAETFEEADDFDVPDDPLPLRSPWENDHDPSVEELLAAGREALSKRSPPDSPPAAAKKPSDPPSDGPATPPPAP